MLYIGTRDVVWSDINRLQKVLTLGFASFSIKAQANVACPACAAIFPFCIFKLSFTTNTNLTSSIADAETDLRSKDAAALSSSASESESVAPSASEEAEYGPSAEPAAGMGVVAARGEVASEGASCASLRFLLERSFHSPRADGEER